MGLDAFFNYPTRAEEADSPEDLVFLPHWDEVKWTKLLAYAGTIRFHPGEDVLRIGDLDRSFYIITEGSLEVLIPRRRGKQMQRIQIMEPGSVIGEVAFVDGRPRSATVRAMTDGEMLRVSATAFETLSAREPDLARDMLFDLARLLSTKLRSATRFISTWVE